MPTISGWRGQAQTGQDCAHLGPPEEWGSAETLMLEAPAGLRGGRGPTARWNAGVLGSEQRNRRMVISVTARVAARRSRVANRTTAMTYNELVDLARLCAYNSRITTDREVARVLWQMANEYQAKSLSGHFRPDYKVFEA
jgi:hypothetical protein